MERDTETDNLKTTADMKGTDHSKRTIQMYLGTACRGRCVFCEELLHVFSYSEIRRIDINWLILPYRTEVYGYLE